MKPYFRSVWFWVGLVLFSLLLVKLPTDPDLWWHLRVGDELRLAGIFPYADHYSHLMPGYAWVDHSWLFDLIVSSVYALSGWWLLTPLFALLYVSVLLIVSAHGSAVMGQQLRRINPLAVFAVSLIGLLFAASFVTVRPQVLSHLFFAVFWLAWLRAVFLSDWRLVRWLPLVFFGWANLHGGFALALGLWAMLIVAYGLQLHHRRLTFFANVEAKSWPLLLNAWLLSVLASLINPYSWRVYQEIIRVSFDSFARGSIQEWLPIELLSWRGGFVVLLAGVIAIICLEHRKRLGWFYPLSLLVLLFMSITGLRQLPFFVMAALPLLMFIVQPLVLALPVKPRLPLQLARIGVVLALALIAGRNLLMLVNTIGSEQRLAEHAELPVGAISWLEQNPARDNLFNHYNWGGYLIHRLPERPVFIDGRMASWNDGQTHALKVYAETLSAKNWSANLAEYKIGTILIPPDTKLGSELEQSSEWTLAYQDELALIYTHLYTPVDDDEPTPRFAE